MKRTFETCCEDCPSYWTCETKWYRGEKGEKDICCDLCKFYEGCLKEQNKSKTLARKGPAVDRGPPGEKDPGP